MFQELEEICARRLIPICLNSTCTGASVRQRGRHFCSELCARLYGEQQALRYRWCVECIRWHDDVCPEHVSQIKREAM